MQEYLAQSDHVGDEKIIGEASPDYLYSELATQNIFDLNPEIKLLAILRNPAERLYSMHQAQLRDLRTKRTWEDAIGDKEWLDKHRYVPHLQR